WSVEVFPASGWLTLTSATSGTGSGSVSYSVAALSLGTRSAVIRAQQDHGAGCTISQALVRPQAQGSPALSGRLDLTGGRGQVVVDGAAVFYQQDAMPGRIDAAREGTTRVEATVVTADGRPGTWRFELAGAEAGTIMVMAGQVREATPASVVFQLSGKPGE